MKRTYTDTETGMTAETVKTSDLREGDVIRHHGAVMKLGPFSTREDEKSTPERGQTRWARGYPIEGYALGRIPAKWLDRDEQGRGYWIVQGNDLATWQRLAEPERVEAIGETRAHAKLIRKQDGCSPHEALMRAGDEGPEGHRERLNRQN